MTTKNIVIFDIDGTLADTSHRTHLVRNKPKNWPRFFDLMVEDPPREHVRTMLWFFHPVAGEDKFYHVYIVSGRPEDYREQTETWLAKHHIKHDGLYMRPTKDSRPDDIIKKEIFDAHFADKKDRILCVFDDRPRVIRMWRAEGIPVFDCGDGVEF